MTGSTLARRFISRRMPAVTRRTWSEIQTRNISLLRAGVVLVPQLDREIAQAGEAGFKLGFAPDLAIDVAVARPRRVLRNLSARLHGRPVYSDRCGTAYLPSRWAGQRNRNERVNPVAPISLRRTCFAGSRLNGVNRRSTPKVVFRRFCPRGDGEAKA